MKKLIFVLACFPVILGSAMGNDNKPNSLFTNSPLLNQDNHTSEGRGGFSYNDRRNLFKQEHSSEIPNILSEDNYTENMEQGDSSEQEFTENNINSDIREEAKRRSGGEESFQSANMETINGVVFNNGGHRIIDFSTPEKAIETLGKVYEMLRDSQLNQPKKGALDIFLKNMANCEPDELMFNDYPANKIVSDEARKLRQLRLEE